LSDGLRQTGRRNARDPVVCGDAYVRAGCPLCADIVEKLAN
jgi:hypothetical protein